jgi:hypothetical protein
MNGYYNIGYLGTGSFRRVQAKNLKEAKRIFAQYYRVRPEDPRIIHRTWTAAVINECVIHDDRLAIDWYRAEKGYPAAEGIEYSLMRGGAEA